MHSPRGLKFKDRSKRYVWKSTLQDTLLLILFVVLVVLLFLLFYPGLAQSSDNVLCMMKGGKWTHVGMDNELRCVITYRDAGKACHSSDECLGGCVIYKPPVQAQPVLTGVCKDTSSPYGCFGYIERPEDLSCRD
jgi:hypothetical protein